MNCPSLITMICMYCRVEYGRKDGVGVSGDSHGICNNCLEVHYGKEVEK